MPQQRDIFFISLHIFHILLKLSLFELHKIILHGDAMLTFGLTAVDNTEYEVADAHHKWDKLYNNMAACIEQTRVDRCCIIKNIIKKRHDTKWEELNIWLCKYFRQCGSDKLVYDIIRDKNSSDIRQVDQPMIA